MQSVSVVIPTLGGNVLKETIKNINRGTFIPSEIIVCIPKTEVHTVERIVATNVKVLTTEVRGQVAQRAAGFQVAKENLVLQLDDDILLAEKALKALVNELTLLGPLNAVGPVYYNNLDFKYCLHRFPYGISGWLRSLEATLFSAAPWGQKRMGHVTKTAMAYGFDAQYLGETPQKTEWLPGGCVLSYKQDLVLERFYPFLGKAYNEDLIHSIFRQRKNVTQWVIPQAKCCTEAYRSARRFTDLTQDIKSRRYILSLLGSGYTPQFISWVIFEYIKEFLKRFLNRPRLFFFHKKQPNTASISRKDL